MIAEVCPPPVSVEPLDGSAVAVFLGIQRSGVLHIPDLPLYNLTCPVGIHPAGSTVSADTLARYGYTPPAQVVAGGVS